MGQLVTVPWETTGLSREGHDIYFRWRTRPRPISRKCHFRDPTFPESNNTESSFNKGSATIYRGYAPHPYLSDPSVHCHRVLSSILPPSLVPFSWPPSFMANTSTPTTILFVDARIFFSVIPLRTTGFRLLDVVLSLSLSLSFLHSLSPLAIFYPRLVALFLTMVITLLRNSFQFIRNIWTSPVITQKSSGGGGKKQERRISVSVLSVCRLSSPSVLVRIVCMKRPDKGKKRKRKKERKKKQKINPGKVRSGGKDTQESREIKPEDILRIPRHKQTDETYARDRIGQVKCFLSNYLRPLWPASIIILRAFSLFFFVLLRRVTNTHRAVTRSLEIFHLPWWNNLATNAQRNTTRSKEIRREMLHVAVYSTQLQIMCNIIYNCRLVV